MYRKYRPKNFSELVGQDHIRDTLRSAVKSNRISHAYLFCGPRGTGKTTTARILAKAINCQKAKAGEACNHCAICKDFISGRSMDLIEIDAASNRGIDEIRGIIEKIKFTPTRTDYKVFVIDEAHMLTKEAFNALLKTLEEPPSHAVFILATTEPHKLPPTILSRVQRFDFQRVNPADIAKRLKKIAQKEKIKVDDEAIEIITEAADGSFRDAESLLDQVASYMNKRIKLADVELILGVSDYQSVVELIDYLIKKDSRAAINLINRLMVEGHDLTHFNKALNEYLRKLMLISKASIDPKELFADPQKPQEQVEILSAGEILQYIKSFIQTQREIKSSTIPQLPLEMAIVELVGEEVPEEANLEIKPVNNKEKSVIQEKVASSIKVKREKKSERIEKKDKIIDFANIDQFLNLWPKLLSTASQINHSLLALLRSSVPVEIKNDTIKLAVHFKFHQDQLMTEKRRQAISKIVKKISGKDYKIECILTERIDKKVINKIISKMAKLDRQTEEDLMKSVSEVFDT